MDFASLMKSQISSAQPSNKKYLKRGDLEAQRKEAYAREQAELEEARLARVEKKRKREEEETQRSQVQKEKRARLADISKRQQDEEAAQLEALRKEKLGLPEPEPVEDTEIVREKLKALGEPRTLFGETHAQRVKRLEALTRKVTDGPIPTTLELVPEKDMRVTDGNDRSFIRRQLASYFDLVLREWQRALAQRAREVKESFSGKQALGNYTAAVSNLMPLFRKLENNELPADLLKPIVEIVSLAQSKRYVDANNAYLRLSIGNTAWPIGVTMVGIHERSAREKLHEDGVSAHIMSDESTRKMIQGIKRSLTYAQTRWPPDELGQLMG